jgi:uncharacterized membrane protein YhaH (DUF805 family)
MKKQNNLYNYSAPKSGNEETSYFLTKGRITFFPFFLRLLLCGVIYTVSFFITAYYTEIYVNQEIGTGKVTDETIITLFRVTQALHFYIIPALLIGFLLIQGAKRMHDINKSGWYFLIPVYNIYLTFLNGTVGSNDYGVDPKPMPKITYFDELETSQEEQKIINKKTKIDSITKERYYKESGKINYKLYLISLLFAIVSCYFIGLFYSYLSGELNSFIEHKILKLDIVNHSNRLGFIVSKTLSLPKGYLVILFILFIYFIPFLITSILTVLLIFLVREFGKSRNKFIDTLSSICFCVLILFVSNHYEISTVDHYIELGVFILLSLIITLGITNYFCEECNQTFKESNFYTISKLDANTYLESIKKGQSKLINRYSEKEILEKESLSNLFYVTLNVCENCSSQILDLKTKIIEIDANNKKTIKDKEDIVKDLIIQ